MTSFAIGLRTVKRDRLCLRIGVEPGSRYSTAREATDALQRFAQAEGLPTPTTSTSDDGSAVHAVWPLTQEIEADDMLRLERELGELFGHLGGETCRDGMPEAASEQSITPWDFCRASIPALERRRADEEKYLSCVEPLAMVALGVETIDTAAAQTGMSPAQLEAVLEHGPTCAAVNRLVARMRLDGTAPRHVARKRLELLASDPLTPASTLTNVVSLLDRLRIPKDQSN
jgi:hypothetical protein